MATTPNYKRHIDLAHRMAAALGVDLKDKLTQGALLLDTLGDAVLRCTCCADVDGGERWLAVQPVGAGRAPAMYRNGDIFKRLNTGGRA